MKLFHFRHKLLFTVFVVGLCSSCDFSTTELPVWELEIFGPIAQTSISLEEVPEFTDFSISGEITSQDALGVSNVTLPFFPATNFGTVGPFSGSTDEFEEVTFQSGDISAFITNDFPVNIKAGGILIVSSGGVEIFQHTIANDINPNGGTYSFNLSNGLAGKNLQSTLDITIENFATDGSNSPVTFDSSTKVTYTFTLNNTTIEEIRIASGTNFSAISEYADFNFTGDEINIETITGDLNVQVTNAMPVVLTTQILFYDVNKSEPPLDSLFATVQTIPAASVNNNGEPILPSSTTLTVSFDAAKYERIKSAKFFRSRIELSSLDGVPSVLLSKDDSLSSKVIGDLIVTVNPE
ncbi:MAG: hypothetical protein ACPGJS_03680 [Flammeovirgaceae bacterium]